MNLAKSENISKNLCGCELAVSSFAKFIDIAVHTSHTAQTDSIEFKPKCDLRVI